MTSCGSCGVPGQPVGARFCFSCGTPLLPASCPTCGTAVVTGARFCSGCGHDLGADAASVAQPVASRRITSVLFGDLVGFTSLSETRDHEEVRELLSRYFEECRAIIARYGGTVEKFIGDAVMAVWGVPTAHEDDAERAVRAGLELANVVPVLGAEIGVPELAMRVGIVTGEVAVTVGAQQQGMVAGDAVNTAARVQSAATPGQVWVDETTRLLTSSAITYLDVGSHPMKGKAEPVPLWSVRAVVAAVGGAQRADGLEAPLVARDRELRLLKEHFHRVEESGLPALLVLDGEAGVGKSRMAWEFEKYVDGLSADVRWHSTRCLSYGEGVAFSALAEAIRARLQIVVGDADVDDQASLLSSGLDHLVDDADERAWLEPRLATLLGVAGTGTFPREDLFAAWTAFLLRVSEDGIPVSLLIDDAQHADDGLLLFLEHLLSAGDFPCFVVLLTRPGLIEANPWLATHRRTAVVHLDALAPREMGQLLDGLVAGLDDDARDSLVQRAEGIPLFAVETVRSLIDRDLVVPRGGQYVFTGEGTLDLDDIGAPASLQALIAARLDTLSPAERRVLDRASVVGRSFSHDLIAALCPDVPDVDAALASLVRLQLLRQETNRFSAEVGLYQFVQVVVRQVAYGTLSRRDRKAGHLAVVALLEDDVDAADETAAIAAQHHLEAIDAVPEDDDVALLTERAVDLLRRAAARARGLGAPAEAAGNLRVALARTTEPAARADLELELARALRDTSDAAAAIAPAASARDAFDALGDDLRAGAAVSVLAHALAVGRLDYESSLVMARERYDALRDRDDAAPVLLDLAQTLIQIKLRTSDAFGDEVADQMRLAELIGDESRIAEAYVGLALHYMVTGSRGVGRVLFEAAAEVSRRRHLLPTLTRSLINLNVAWSPDDLGRGAAFGAEALAVGRQAGSHLALAIAASNMALTWTLTGDWDDALTIVDDPASEPLLVELARARIMLARGQEWQLADDLDNDEYAGDDLSLRCFLELLRALDALAVGRPAGALALRAVETAYAAASLYDDFTVIWQVATETAWADGDQDAIAGLLGIVDDHRGSGIPLGVRAQRDRLGALQAADAGDLVGAETLLRQAIDVATQWGSPPMVAQSRADLAVVLQRVGRTVDAAALAQEARATFDALGAVSWSAALDLALAGLPA
ncbi:MULTISPECIES: adenylate/guanylate cyclase domain-containing protein [unclassified Nocardioides]|uniref:adenylate/guanylate cyclase domain-containing protein n=1 Tax=unclassified Nocardioides TaxID=2615069 RepID=UPI00138F8F9A|nr:MULTISPECIES: adenylate/guanylate cyclase domain-containing protein [unclassified Nocardioides]